MKTEEQINKRIRDLFTIPKNSLWSYDAKEVSSEIATLHWVIDDKAVLTTKKPKQKGLF